MPDAVDLLIHARWIIPIVPSGFLENAALVIKNAQIIDCLPLAEAEARYNANSRVDLPNHALLPGLVNAHTHAAMSLLRGVADDLPLKIWLEKHIWPLEARFVGEEFVRVGSQLAAAEMIQSGTTTFADMYFFPEMTAEVVESIGMRALLGTVVIDFPTQYGQSPEEYFEKGRAFHARYQNHPKIFAAWAPHAPYTVSDDPLKKLRIESEKTHSRIHMHVHETVFEVSETRPLARLLNLGLLTERFMAVHMTQLNSEEIQMISEKKVHIVHCPESNLKLGSGFCPTAALLSAGANLALGTDGAASNNDLDLLSEMRTAALLAKGFSGDPCVFSAQTALNCATLGGARALGLAHQIGSLEPGKQADCIALDLSGLAQQPIYNPISQIVYATPSTRVDHVWVSGKLLFSKGNFLTLDEESLRRDILFWRNQIAQT